MSTAQRTTRQKRRGSESMSCPAGEPASHLAEELRAFDDFGTTTTVATTEAEGPGGPVSVETYVNEFWTSKQRAASRLHEVSYRACFKPQLPRFFIDRLTDSGDVVYDPFMGRGTTPIEAALAGRVPYGCDINPLSEILVRPRLDPPELSDIEERLTVIASAGSASAGVRAGGSSPGPADDHLAESEIGGVPVSDLRVFYHPDTLRELLTLRRYFLRREEEGTLDGTDRWIRMVAVNRLTGHSSGFFSVYTLPPNQAVSARSQRRINDRRDQAPPRRDVWRLTLKKSRAMMSAVTQEDRTALSSARGRSLLLTGRAGRTPEIADSSVSLVVTSPPFLDVVDYAKDNWLRCWFCGISADEVPVTVTHDLDEWREAMTNVFHELARVLRPGGHVAFEVGEVRSGTIRLEESVIPCGMRAGLTPVLVLINDQEFTKTANVWGVDNRAKGTNTNRVVLFKRG